MTHRIMKRRYSRHTTCLWILAIFTVAVHNVCGEPEPLPGMIYTDNYAEDSESFLLIQRLKEVAALKHRILEEERELTEAELEIQAILEAKVRNQRVPQPIQPEYSAEEAPMLPIPSTIQHHGPTHSGKRTSYMALCHFKICNMGRKRQL